MTKEKPLSEKKNQINLYGKQFNYLKIEDVAKAVEKLKEDIIDMRDYVGLIHFNRVIVQINSIFGSFDSPQAKLKENSISFGHKPEDTLRGCGKEFKIYNSEYKFICGQTGLCPKCEVGK